LVQTTRYPWDGRVEIVLSPQSEAEFSLFLRIPGWSQAVTIAVDGEVLKDVTQPGSYHEIHRRWRPGSRITLEMAMPSVLMVSNPMAAENRCSVAVKRGPLVYCFESVDNPGFSVRQARLRFDPQQPLDALRAEHRDDLLGGVTVLHGLGSVPTEAWGPLYRPFSADPTPSRLVELVGIPYYAWANRGVGEMTVWLQKEP
ncbi:MAG: glycoside hydrolase family 127 protein, partial [Chloroflexi bacterium]|nr:glycoside hydrolase family 127 protein [Chloroflexota bacterium]